MPVGRTVEQTWQMSPNLVKAFDFTLNMFHSKGLRQRFKQSCAGICMMIINFNNTCFNCTHFDHSLWLKVDHSSRFLVRPTHDWNLREFPWIKHHMTWDPRNSHGELVRNTSLWKGSINLFSCILVIPKFPREAVKKSSSYLRHST